MSPWIVLRGRPRSFSFLFLFRQGSSSERKIKERLKKLTDHGEAGSQEAMNKAKAGLTSSATPIASWFSGFLLGRAGVFQWLLKRKRKEKDFPGALAQIFTPSCSGFPAPCLLRVPGPSSV